MVIMAVTQPQNVAQVIVASRSLEVGISVGSTYTLFSERQLRSRLQT